MSITSDLVNIQNSTALTQAKQETAVDHNEMNADMFLKLMLEQLKYQDPLEPVSNTEFLSQQATFSQLQELMDLNNETTSANSVQQALNLVGKEVTLKDPNDAEKTITGVVKEASFDETIPTITVNGTKYPLTNVTKVSEISADTTQVTQNSESINSIKDTLSNLSSNFSGLAETVGTISTKMQEYLQ